MTRLTISDWLKIKRDASLKKLRKQHISNEEWKKICDEYENFCKKNGIKPDYLIDNDYRYQ